MIKSYYAEKAGIDPKDIVVVSVMPCVAKKFEITRDDQGHDGMQDNDISISTRELAKMIKTAGIQFTELEDDEFDPLMAIGSGAGTIFGATGGVMESVQLPTFSQARISEISNILRSEAQTTSRRLPTT